MPIKPENKARYPKDWKAISDAARKNAGHRCEWEGCGARQYSVGVWQKGAAGLFTWAPIWGQDDNPRTYAEARQIAADEQFSTYGDEDESPRFTVIVLTVAHLGIPAHLPMHLHVTTSAETDEVFQVVGFLMPFNAKEPEWAHMMHSRALSEFDRGSLAGSAGFFVSIPRILPSDSPGRSVVIDAASVAPELIRLTDWRLLTEPREAALVSAKATAGPNMKSADVERLAAAFTHTLAEPAFRQAHCFVGTGLRTSLLSIASLRGSQQEDISADGTRSTAMAAAHSSSYARTLDATPDGRSIFDAAFDRAAFPRSFGVVREFGPTASAQDVGGRFSWSGHDAMLMHTAEYPQNCEPSNLRAWCQRHHLAYDHELHQRNAQATRRAKSGNLDLFA